MSLALPNLRHLQLFLTVLRLGSVSAAARAAHLSQPAVSQALAGVENHLGGELLTRSSQGLVANPSGRAVAERTRRALELLQEPLEWLRSRAAGARQGGLRGITAAQLDALAGVAQHGSFVAAAARSGCTRAAVHRAVRQLEAVTGVSLVDHTAGRLSLTREGERLALRARLAAAEMLQARDEVSQAAGRGGGRSVIGAMPLARSVIVPRAVLAFAALRPDHDLSILDGPYGTLLSALRSGQADLLVGALRDPPPAADVIQELLFDDPLSIIARAGHPLAAARAADTTALARYAWIAPRQESPLRRHFDLLQRHLAACGRPAHIECNSWVAARALLLGSDRLMLLSEHQVRHELSGGQLVALAHPLGRVTRPIGLTLRRGWHPTQAQAQLLTIVRTIAGEAARRATGQRIGRPAAASPARKSRGESRWKRAKKRLK